MRGAKKVCFQRSICKGQGELQGLCGAGLSTHDFPFYFIGFPLKARNTMLAARDGWNPCLETARVKENEKRWKVALLEHLPGGQILFNSFKAGAQQGSEALQDCVLGSAFPRCSSALPCLMLLHRCLPGSGKMTPGRPTHSHSLLAQ